MATVREFTSPRGDGSTDASCRHRRRATLFEAFVAFFDDPILLCDTGGHRPHRCEGDEVARVPRWARVTDPAVLRAGA